MMEPSEYPLEFALPVEELFARLPDLDALAAGLTAVFRTNLSLPAPVTVLERQPNDWARTFPSEIVRCRFANGSERQLFCKYMFGLPRDHEDHGSRGGVSYEALVYRSVLQHVPGFAPRFHGLHEDPVGGAWLILDNLDDAIILDRTEEADGLTEAASWIGRFHGFQEARLSRTETAGLKRHDADYYRGWARRTALFAGPQHERFPWLGPLCRRFEEETAAGLAALPPTIIHGEYYPHNVLIAPGAVYVVDWESAALAAGEIDLASLTDGWPSDETRECEARYRHARWGEAVPADFGRRVDTARLFLQFRWMGDQPEWTTRADADWRFAELRAAGERLGLI